jgi:hypothetical protein
MIPMEAVRHVNDGGLRRGRRFALTDVAGDRMNRGGPRCSGRRIRLTSTPAPGRWSAFFLIDDPAARRPAALRAARIPRTVAVTSVFVRPRAACGPLGEVFREDLQTTFGKQDGQTAIMLTVCRVGVRGVRWPAPAVGGAIVTDGLPVDGGATSGGSPAGLRQVP